VLCGISSVNEELRERVGAAIRKLDYHPNHMARSLKSRQTKMLGMLISDITNPFFPLVVRGAEDAASAHGYFLITFNTDDRIERERQVLSLLRSRRVDGVLLVVAPNSDASHIERIIDDGIPIVCIDRIPNSKRKFDSICVDNVKGAQICVQHLIMRGHTRIAIITGSLALQSARERLTGYERALAEAGLEVERDLALEGDFRQESGLRLGKNLLLRHRRPTALFVSNGMMTIGVLEALEEMGLSCPNDIALATFDDLPMAKVFRPHLTSVSQPSYQIGYQGADLLLKRLRGEASDQGPVTILLEPELKIRESTATVLPRTEPHPQR
jgi:LacI family transcriptional regulator